MNVKRITEVADFLVGNERNTDGGGNHSQSDVCFLKEEHEHN